MNDVIITEKKRQMWFKDLMTTLDHELEGMDLMAQAAFYGKAKGFYMVDVITLDEFEKIYIRLDPSLRDIWDNFHV